MKLKSIFLMVTLILLTACSMGQSNTVQATSTALQTQPTIDIATEAVSSDVIAPVPVFTSTPKPPLANRPLDANATFLQILWACF